MVTCKDCVYFDVCSALNPEFKKYPKDYIDSDLCAKQCTTFKNSSRFVELPLTVGDSFFTINYNKDAVIKQSVVEIRIINDIEGNAVLFFGQSTIFTINQIGIISFTTREEAEQALKERSE